MVNYGQLLSTVIHCNPLWSTIINYGQLKSTIINYGQLKSTKINYNQTIINYGQPIPQASQEGDSSLEHQHVDLAGRKNGQDRDPVREAVEQNGGRSADAGVGGEYRGVITPHIEAVGSLVFPRVPRDDLNTIEHY